MQLGMAVRAQQYALLCFVQDSLPFPVRERSQVKGKVLGRGIGVMEFECRMILAVTTPGTSPSLRLDQLQFARPAAPLLCLVGLQGEVVVRVLADPGAVFCLPTLQQFAAFDALGHGTWNGLCSKP
jgi:hypothetical protein